MRILLLNLVNPRETTLSNQLTKTVNLIIIPLS